MFALRRADLGEFFSEFIRFTLFTGFFWWLLINGPVFASSIIEGLRAIAGNASGLGPGLTPSGIVDVGFAIFYRVLDASTAWRPLDSLVGLVMSGIILVVMALVGVNMLLLLVSGWMLAYAGIFFLGFGGSRWTSDMAINYYKTVLNIGAQAFAMVLVVGIGWSFVDQYYRGMSQGLLLKELAVILIVSVVLLSLVNKVPPLVGGLATGGGAGALGSGLGAGAAVASAALAATAVGAVASVAAAGIRSAAGGATALGAAYQKAQASMAGGGSSSSMPSLGSSGASTSSASGGGGNAGMSFSSAAGIGSDNGFSGGSDKGAIGDKSTAAARMSPSPLATARQAAGKAGRLAVSTGANLAKGGASVLKAKISEEIGSTVGGKIAAAIKASGPGRPAGSEDSAAGAESPAFTGNSLSGETQVDPEAEVAAFVNRVRDTTT